MTGLVTTENKVESILKNLRFPSQYVWNKRDTTKFVKDINNTFGINTSMMERLGLFVLFLNIDKLEPIVDFTIKYYYKKNNKDIENNKKINVNSIITALRELNRSSAMPFKIKIKGGDGNVKHTKNILIMIIRLIGEIIFLVCVTNSLKGKVDESIALNALKGINAFQKCQHKTEIVLPLQFARDKLKGYSPYDNSAIEAAARIWECYNTDNVLVSALEIVTQEEYIETENREINKEYLALPMPVQQNSKDLVAYENYFFENAGTPKQRYDKLIELYDGIINEKDDGHTTYDTQEVGINEVVNWFGEKILKLSKSALDSLKEGKINPLFWEDSMIRIKAYAKTKKQELEASVNEATIKMESAIDELSSIFWHIGFVYFCYTRVFFKSIILYKYINAIYNQEGNLLKEKQEDTPDKFLLGDKKSDDEEKKREDAVAGLLTLTNSFSGRTDIGGKSKKNKTNNKGGKSKKNNKGGKSKKNKTRKSNTRKNKTRKN